MADGSLNPLSDSSLASGEKALTAIMARQRESEGKLGQAQTQEQEEFARADKIRDEGEARLAKQADSLTPPKMEQIPPPVVQNTDPKTIWGSAAMFVAAFGGMMTRRPLVTAMNAAAGVINAYKKGDIEAANQAMQTWKVASENATKAAEFEQKAYDEALAGIDRHINVLDRENQAAIREATARFTAAAAAFHNDTALQAAQSGEILRVLEFKANLTAQTQRVREAAPKVAEEQALYGAWIDWQKKHPNAGPDEALEAFGKFKKELAPNHEWTPSEITSAADREVAALQRPGSVGAAYNTIVQKMQAIRQYTSAPRGTVADATLADAFTQIINGGRAIRGFQMQMLTDHRGLVDALNTVAEQVMHHGATLSPQQADAMISISQAVAADINKQYRDEIHRAEQRAEKLGLPDPSVVVPPSYDPDLIPSMTNQQQPPAAAVEHLRQHPELRQQFDQKYGQGAAARALGQ